MRQKIDLSRPKLESYEQIARKKLLASVLIWLFISFLCFSILFLIRHAINLHQIVFPNNLLEALSLGLAIVLIARSRSILSIITGKGKYIEKRADRYLNADLKRPQIKKVKIFF